MRLVGVVICFGVIHNSQETTIRYKLNRYLIERMVIWSDPHLSSGGRDLTSDYMHENHQSKSTTWLSKKLVFVTSSYRLKPVKLVQVTRWG